MKVRLIRSAPALVGRLAVAIAAVAFVSLLFTAPAPAHAITRDEVVARASRWVSLRLGYSRTSYFGGYRKDCSGMVSMAWRLGRSYTSRSISSRAVRIPLAALRPGDAILTPGHVAVFAGWANRGSRTFIALEQSGRGVGAVRRVKRINGRAVALRRRGIQDGIAAAATASPTAVTVTAAPTTATPPLTATTVTTLP